MAKRSPRRFPNLMCGPAWCSNVMGALRWKRAKTHRGSRRRRCPAASRSRIYVSSCDHRSQSSRLLQSGGVHIRPHMTLAWSRRGLKGRGSGAKAVYQPREHASNLLAYASAVGKLDLSKGAGWGADPRLAVPFVNARGGAVGHATSARRSSRRMPLALSTLSGVRPMIAITPLARAAELYARMDAERRPLRLGR